MADPLVRNGSDPEQVRKAGIKANIRRKRAMLDFKAVLETRQGRLVIRRLIEACGYGKSIWRQSAEIHYLAGRQDVGNELVDEIKAIDPGLLTTMEVELREEEEKDG